MSYYAGGFNGDNFLLVLVLFILLVIVGVVLD